MLVLKLKVGDRVEIGDGVVLECRHVSPGTLRLAIAAPADMGITHRLLAERTGNPAGIADGTQMPGGAI